MLRYWNGDSNTVLAERPLSVDPMDVTLSGPETTESDTLIEIGWQGPGGRRDTVQFFNPVDGKVRASKRLVNDDFDNRKVVVKAPKPGTYLLRYWNGDYSAVLTERSITVQKRRQALATGYRLRSRRVGIVMKIGHPVMNASCAALRSHVRTFHDARHFCRIFFAGCVKGTVGMGLPLVTVGLLTAFIGLKPALALLLVPAFLTNVWQSLAGEHTRKLLRWFWNLFVPTMLFIWLGTMALARINVGYLLALLGVLLMIFATINLSRLQFRVPRGWEGRLNPLVGAASGVLAGMTGAFTVLGVAYLQSTGLKRDELIQAMGILFTLSTVGLSVSLGGQNLLTVQLASCPLPRLFPPSRACISGHASESRHRNKASG